MYSRIADITHKFIFFTHYKLSKKFLNSLLAVDEKQKKRVYKVIFTVLLDVLAVIIYYYCGNILMIVMLFIYNIN